MLIFVFPCNSRPKNDNGKTFSDINPIPIGSRLWGAKAGKKAGVFFPADRFLWNRLTFIFFLFRNRFWRKKKDRFALFADLNVLSGSVGEANFDKFFGFSVNQLLRLLFHKKKCKSHLLGTHLVLIYSDINP